MTFIFNWINQPFVKKGRLPFLELTWSLVHKFKFLIKATENSGSLDEKNFSSEDIGISDTESLGSIPENTGIDNIILTKNSEKGVNNMGEQDMERDVNVKTDGTENRKKEMRDFKHLWIACENCYAMHYKEFFNATRICDKCEFHIKMSSSDRLALLIDEGTWIPMDEDTVLPPADRLEADRKNVYKEYKLNFSAFNFSMTQKLNNWKKKVEEGINDKYGFKCGFDSPDFFRDFIKTGIDPFQIFFGCAKYDKRDSGFFEECSKKGGLYRSQILWTLSKYYQSADEDDFRKFISNDYEACSKDYDGLSCEALEEEFYEKNFVNDKYKIYYFNKYCDDFCTIIPLFFKFFFETRVDLPRLEQFCSKFGIDLSKFFDSFPKREIDLRKFFQECSSLWINFRHFINFYENKFSYDFFKLVFCNPIPRTVYGIYKFWEESSKNELDLFFLLGEIDESERFRITSKLSKTFCCYKFDKQKVLEKLTEIITQGLHKDPKRYIYGDVFYGSKTSREHIGLAEDFKNQTDVDPEKDSLAASYRDQIDFALDSNDPIDFAKESRDHGDPDEDCQNQTALDPAKYFCADSSGRGGVSEDHKNHMDFAKYSRGDIALSEDFNKQTDLDPDRDSSSSGRKDSKDHIDRDEDCQPRTVLDPDKYSSVDLLGRRDSNEYEEEDGDCPNPPGHNPDQDYSGDPACQMDDINLYKEEEGTLASIFTDSEDVTYIYEDVTEINEDVTGINEYVTEINEEDISEKEKEGEEQAAGCTDYSGSGRRNYRDCSDYCEFEGTDYQDHIGLSPQETRLEEISEKDKEGSKKEEESAESSDFESEFEFDWDEFREALNKKDSDFGSKSEFEWRDGSKEEEESAESNDFELESYEEESAESNDFEPESDEEESAESNDFEPESDEEEYTESNDFEPESDEEEYTESNDFEPEYYEEEYTDYVEYYDYDQNDTGLPEAIQTGIGELNGIPVAIGVMDFEFVGGSMGAAVGEKITRLIEYATKNLLPLIIVCASGGARVQEGMVSLMQMAKISSALYDYYYKAKIKLLYISILASPTTGGVLASFGMLGHIIITEPDTDIAFAGKRVIEEVLKKEVPEGLQTGDNLFEKGLFDSIVPRTFLKSALSELLELHGFFPLNKNQAER